VRLEGLGQLKNPVASSGIEPVTLYIPLQNKYGRKTSYEEIMNVSNDLKHFSEQTKAIKYLTSIWLLKTIIFYSVHYQSLFKPIRFGNWFYCCYHVHRV
jgi:hypothetical protein